MKEIEGFEVLEDRSPGHPLNGYLTIHRLVVRTRYADGSMSAPYPCEYITREGVDAVCVAIYTGSSRETRVLLRHCARPPAYFRKDRDLPVPDGEAYRTVVELVAGVLEKPDRGMPGVRRRAAAEVHEEAGFVVSPDEIEILGAPFFPTPGVYDEKVYVAAVRVDPESQGRPGGDGSAMEEEAQLVWLPLDEAMARCRDGRIADAKTEIALLRLKERIGKVESS